MSGTFANQHENRQLWCLHMHTVATGAETVDTAVCRLVGARIKVQVDGADNAVLSIQHMQLFQAWMIKLAWLRGDGNKSVAEQPLD